MRKVTDKIDVSDTDRCQKLNVQKCLLNVHFSCLGTFRNKFVMA